MVPAVLKEFLVPGSILFFLAGVTLGTLLLFRKTGNGRAGRTLLATLVLFYWTAATPTTSRLLIRLLSPDYPPVQSPSDARGATAIVVLGGGVHEFRSRGDVLLQGSREHTLRAIEAARVYRLLDRPWVIVTGGLPKSGASEAMEMSGSLAQLGVQHDRIVSEGKSRNTRDHTLYVPPMLAARGIKQFVLVTSRQHMARSLRAFRAAGFDPIPSSPEVLDPNDGMFERIVPSKGALDATTALTYDLLASVYYRVRGWI